MPVWTRPERPTRGPRFSREQIADTALAIADREGIEAVSMRRVAAELGAGTMTLYHYVQNKHELLELMNESMMGELLVDDQELAGGWREGLRAIAHASLRTWRAHGWLASEMAHRGLTLGPNSLRHFEQSLAAVAGIDLPPDRRFELVAQVDDYVAGFVQRERDVFSDPEAPHWSEDLEEMVRPMTQYLAKEIGTGEYPNIEAFMGDDDFSTVLRRAVEGSTRDERFERGLDRILDGFAIEIERAGR